jgi:hypothetical protein
MRRFPAALSGNTFESGNEPESPHGNSGSLPNYFPEYKIACRTEMIVS